MLDITTGNFILLIVGAVLAGALISLICFIAGAFVVFKTKHAMTGESLLELPKFGTVRSKEPHSYAEELNDIAELTGEEALSTAAKRLREQKGEPGAIAADLSIIQGKG